jgi:polar amino acid transport system substrate-binding protein
MSILSTSLLAQGSSSDEKIDLTVGVAGSPPFVVDTTNQTGISMEMWEDMASRLGWPYQTRYYDDVPQALEALQAGQVDLVVGPVSITADRAAKFRFTQPYFLSSLSILSRSDPPTLWERISPFFSKRFFGAVCVFILILGGVGTLLWLAERERNAEQFPHEPAKGIANGMWCAIVTMSTTGYGDRTPVTFWGRLIAGCWMVISIIFATTMVAGIASTLTLTGLNTSTIDTATELGGRKVAVIDDSPAEGFVHKYGAHAVTVDSLEVGYKLLKGKQVDALVYDRTQLQYFLKNKHDEDVNLSIAEYDRQGYGFALPIHSTLLHKVNVALLMTEESGRSDLIINSWLKGE